MVTTLSAETILTPMDIIQWHEQVVGMDCPEACLVNGNRPGYKIETGVGTPLYTITWMDAGEVDKYIASTQQLEE